MILRNFLSFGIDPGRLFRNRRHSCLLFDIPIRSQFLAIKRQQKFAKLPRVLSPPFRFYAQYIIDALIHLLCINRKRITPNIAMIIKGPSRVILREIEFNSNYRKKRVAKMRGVRYVQEYQDKKHKLNHHLKSKMGRLQEIE